LEILFFIPNLRKVKEGKEWKELNEVNKKIETYLTELEYE